jgi:ferredoxin
MDICPVLCIHPAPKEGLPDMLFIDPGECIDCALCVAECPVEAIFSDSDVPDEWHSYIALNQEAFNQAA